MIETSKLYKSIDFLNTEIYKPGKQHPLIYIKTVSTRDANRIPIKLKVVSGQYILQANRARFNQNQVDTICQLCGEEEENMEHFLLKCTILQAVSVLDDIDTEFNIITGKTFYNLDSYLKIQILLDCSVLLNYDNPVCKDKLLLKQLTQLESQCRRFIYNMHTSRYKMLIRVKSSRVSRSRKLIILDFKRLRAFLWILKLRVF